MTRVLLMVFLAALVAIVSVCHVPVPGGGPVASWAASAFLGALLGAALALLSLVSWRYVERAIREEGTGERVVNAMMVGFAGATAGGVLYVSLGAIFGPSTGSHVAQGLRLGGSVLLGARVGYALTSPILASLGREARTAHGRPRPERAPKVLDTSAIIDGRIGELVRTGFVEGEVVVPKFVLSKLQGTADSSSSLRRRKGRRGLDVLQELMEDDSVSIRVSMTDYPEIRETDRKLIRITKAERGVLIMTGFNLNRVAQVEGVKILNVDELAQAVPPRFIPGENLRVEVSDRGEEIGRISATWLMVRWWSLRGRRHIGRTIKATAQSMLQTEAGRMLFVEPAGEYSR